MNTLVASASVHGGSGSDTLAIESAWWIEASPAVRLDFASDQFAVSGASLDGFENLDAAFLTNNLTVHASGSGSTIATGSGSDQIFLGAGADTVNTGYGIDTVTGAPSEGDSIVFLDSGTLVIDSALAPTVNFHAESTSPGTINVTAASGAVVLDLVNDLENFYTIACGYRRRCLGDIAVRRGRLDHRGLFRRDGRRHDKFRSKRVWQLRPWRRQRYGKLD
jgi:Ca2+-binding RTX toxin-like protein